jgi:hypothetical protein
MADVTFRQNAQIKLSQQKTCTLELTLSTIREISSPSTTRPTIPCSGMPWGSTGFASFFSFAFLHVVT